MEETAHKTCETERWSRFGRGFVLGALAGTLMWVLNLNVVISYFQHLVPVMGMIGGLIGLTRWRKILWIVNAILIGMLLVISYTPMARWMVQRLDRQDEIENSDAVVVLASGYFENGVIAARSQDRVLHGLELLHAGYAPRLVLTRPTVIVGDWPAMVEDEMHQLGEDYPVDVVGPVRDTHDEAVVVAKLAHERGWKRMILVTHAWHMKRAAALFEKQDVKVICAPCMDSSFNERDVQTPGDRINAFGVWLHEEIGFAAYRFRGWV